MPPRPNTRRKPPPGIRPGSATPTPLGRSVEEDWRGLLGSAARLLGPPTCKGPKLRDSELVDLQRCLERLQDWADERAHAGDVRSVASALSTQQPALLHLMAWSARLQAEAELISGAQQNVAMSVGVLVSRMIKAAAAGEAPEAPTVAFCRQLLRTQPLRAVALQLFARLKALEAATAVYTDTPSRDRQRKVIARLKFCRAALLTVLPLHGVARLVGAMAFVTRSQDGATPLYGEFVAELEASHVMEHGARLLMQQARAIERLEAVRAVGSRAPRGCQEAAADALGPLGRCIALFLTAYNQLHTFLTHVPGLVGPAAEAGAGAGAAAGSGGPGRGGGLDPVRSLRRILEGPALRFAVLVYGIRTLCAADGGPAYGLPEVASGVPALSGEPEGPQGKRHIADLTFLKTVCAVISAPHAARTPPLTSRAAAALALRLGRIALATARGCGTTPPPTKPSPDNPRLVLGSEAWSPALRVALEVCLSLQDEGETPGGPRPRLFRRPSWAAEAEAAWRLWVDAVRWAVPVMPEGATADVARHGSRMLASAPEELCDEDASAFPLEAPPELSAPLRAGCLPALELVIRRAGEEPEGPYGHLLAAMSDGFLKDYAEPVDVLLYYGEPAQGAALAASMGTVLRRLKGSPDVLTGRWRHGEDSRQATPYLAAQLLQRAPSAQHVAEMPSLMQRQSLLMCLAATEWLPPLSLLARRAAEQVLSREAASCSEPQPLGAVCGGLADVLNGLLMWVAALAAEGEGEPAAAQPAASRSAVGSGPRLSAWQRFAVEEAGAVQLVGAALALAERREAGASSASCGGGPQAGSDEEDDLCAFVVAACCLRLARLLPARELLAAAGEGPRFPWRPEALRALRANVEADAKCKEDGAVCGAALEQLAAGLERASSGAEGLGVSTEALGRGMQAACSVSEALLEPPALQPLAEARALRPPRACANPACVSLAGDSAADAPPPRPAGLGGCCSEACAQELAGRGSGHD
ncbi:hypothetical protein HYH03_006228 [Edaphochlamys debaryana]|uniref:Uncharacterized protein n=1 Tax=Edaphochlamys debaryana TaxID=47281 RepID=A0A836C1H6_9CHLO|nr:hypothetical protein HYH03_006228 [Edaphochlamys debaryana]|eukprot:KAG2495628.1 hypothetical protein HYH03_006228 [Edaphochlamys debaryana]